MPVSQPVSQPASLWTKTGSNVAVAALIRINRVRESLLFDRQQ